MASKKDSDNTIESLHKRIEFLESILNSMPFNVFAKDLDCKYVYNNKYSESINKVEHNGLIGKSDFDIWPSQDLAQQYFDIDQKQIHERTSFRDLIPTLDNNQVTYQEMFKEPIVNKNNDITGILGVVLPPKKLEAEEPKEKIKEEKKLSLKKSNLTMIFDYYFETDEIVVLKEIPGFKIIENNHFIKSQILPEDYPLLLKTKEDLMEQNTTTSQIIRCFNNKKEIVTCHLELHCYYDNYTNPIRASGFLRPITDNQEKELIISTEILNGKKQILKKFNNTYDLCLYANPSLNYYFIYQSKGFFTLLKKTGEWNHLIDILFEHLYPEDYGILKNIFLTLNLYNENELEATKYKEFRIIQTDGQIRWKSFDAINIPESKNGAFILYFFDVNENVIERQQRTTKEMNSELIDVLSTFVEFRDMESGEHIFRIKSFTRTLLKIANKLYDDLNYSNELIEIISLASAMHDIGKIAIPDNILLKPGKLTPEEFEIMKTHTIKGCEMLKTMPKIQEATYFKYSYDICRHHHERYDGRGYPDGLKGEEISLEAQIVSLADVFDALTSERCYKKAFSFDKATKMILSGECGVFSERILKCFNAALPELKSICNELK